MAFCKKSFFKITLISIVIFSIFVNAHPKARPGIPVDKTFKNCMKKIMEHCDATTTLLNAVWCARRVLYYWDKTKAVHPIVQKYHDHLIDKITYRAPIDEPTEHCNKISLLNIHENFGQPVEYNEADCLGELSKFGGNIPDIFKHALFETNVRKESESGSKVYGVSYMMHLERHTTVKDGTTEPDAYCQNPDRAREAAELKRNKDSAQPLQEN